MFTAADYAILHNIVFNPKCPYPGYRPNVVEAPNGDGNWDDDKRYAHVATKYLDQVSSFSYNYRKDLKEYLVLAHRHAHAIAIALGVPAAFWPVLEYGALRVLEYKPGAITHTHTDFNLFTLMCYRNKRDYFVYDESVPDSLEYAQTLNSQIHFGELLELIIPTYKATKHSVKATEDGSTQFSIVYFAIPDHSLVLPSGKTVGAWLEERIARSRKEVNSYA